MMRALMDEVDVTPGAGRHHRARCAARLGVEDRAVNA